VPSLSRTGWSDVASRNPHDLHGIADNVGGALLAFRACGHQLSMWSGRAHIQNCEAQQELRRLQPAGLKLEAPAWLSELERLAHPGELPLEVIEGLLDLIEAGEQIVAFKTYRGPAPIADEVVISLDPSDRLRGLLAAAGARNIDGLPVEVAH
jgi:hypothetical protein